MKKIIILRIILIVLILLWMRLVFGLSSDNAEESTSISMRIAMFFTKDEQALKIVQPIVRKIAHLSEYMAGGFLFYGFFLTFNISAKKQVIFAGILGIFYSITDEIHQLFVPRKSRKN